MDSNFGIKKNQEDNANEQSSDEESDSVTDQTRTTKNP